MLWAAVNNTEAQNFNRIQLNDVSSQPLCPAPSSTQEAVTQKLVRSDNDSRVPRLHGRPGINVIISVYFIASRRPAPPRLIGHELPRIPGAIPLTVGRLRQAFREFQTWREHEWGQSVHGCSIIAAWRVCAQQCGYGGALAEE